MAHTSRFALLKDISLSMDYTDTLIFASQTTQTSYFTGKIAYNFDGLMYVRENQVVIPNQAGPYRSCTYVMYNNPDYPGKWFYAFIADVTYVADGTTRITFVEDFIQTWFFEMNIGMCLVEREHVYNDSVGSNLVEETLPTGEFIVNNTQYVNFTTWTIVIVSSVRLNNPEMGAYGTPIGKIYNGVDLYGYTFANWADASSALERVDSVGRSDAITSIYMVPSIFAKIMVTGVVMPVDTPINFPIPKVTKLNGYTPKNNKLFTYPYCALRMSTNSGQNVVLRYEFIKGDTLSYIGGILPNSKILMYPKGYKGSVNGYDYAISLGDYPQCAWIKDVYSNWLATESVKWDYQEQRREMNYAFADVKAGVNGVLPAIGNLLSGNPAGSVREGISTLMDFANNAIDNAQNNMLAKNVIAEETEVHQMIPPSTRGTIGNDTTLINLDGYGFKVEALSISAEYAKIIDDYWSLYGYPIRTVKYPNLNSRKVWNYVKTVNATVTGNAPAYAREGFKGLLNRGIRFWHTDTIGNYNQDNSIVG